MAPLQNAVCLFTLLLSSFQRPLFVLADRNVDMATPLHHSWTYQALIHDVLVSCHSHISELMYIVPLIHWKICIKIYAVTLWKFHRQDTITGK